jgi:hypothetical protein
LEKRGQATLKNPPRKKIEEPWRSLARCSIRAYNAYRQTSTHNAQQALPPVPIPDLRWIG